MLDVQKEVDMQDDGALRAVEQIPSLEERTLFRWSRFLLESVVAIGGALLVTGLISLFHLYPQIPNISLVYLLVILLLASTFGRYAATDCATRCIAEQFCIVFHETHLPNC